MSATVISFSPSPPQKVVLSLSIYTLVASKEDQALLMDIRMKNMINSIAVIMTFIVLEPQNCSPSMCETDCQVIGGECQLIGCDGHIISCDGQLIDCDGQLIAVYSNSSANVFQLKFLLMPGQIFHSCLGFARNRLLLQQEWVCGPLQHRCQLHAHQHAFQSHGRVPVP